MAEDSPTGWKKTLDVSNVIGAAAILGGSVVSILSWMLSWPGWALGSGVTAALLGSGIVCARFVSVSADLPFETIGEWKSGYRSLQNGSDSTKKLEGSVADHASLRLTVKIIEAFIIPNKGRTADCFLRVIIHNNTKVECSNPLRYVASLRINNKEYSYTSPLDLHAHQLAQYKLVEEYYEGQSYEAEQNLAKEGLRPNLLGEKDFLVKGKPLVGWLGMQFHYLPEWHYHKEIIRYTESPNFDEETEEIKYEYEPEYEYTPTLQTISSLKLEVTDPYQKTWVDETSAFNPIGKRIEKRKRKGDESP